MANVSVGFPLGEAVGAVVVAAADAAVGDAGSLPADAGTAAGKDDPQPNEEQEAGGGLCRGACCWIYKAAARQCLLC